MLTTTGSNRLKTTVKELSQCNDLLNILTDELVEMLEESCDKATTKWVIGVLDAMLENLQKQFELEEAGEYLADVLEQYPNWHPQVEHLRQQHELLHGQLREIRERIAEHSDDSDVYLESRRQLHDWIATYNEHQQRERLLIQDAFALDIGQGD